MGPVGFGVEQLWLIWAMWRRGDPIRPMERTLGKTLPRIRRYLCQSAFLRSVISLANQHTVGSVTATHRAGSAHSAPLAANNRPIVVSPPATCRADG